MPRNLDAYKDSPENWKYHNQTINLPTFLKRELGSYGNKSLQARAIMNFFIEYLDALGIDKLKQEVATLSVSVDRKVIRKIYKKYIQPRFFLSFSEFMRFAIFWYIFKDRPKLSIKKVFTNGEVIELDGKEYIIKK